MKNIASKMTNAQKFIGSRLDTVVQLVNVKTK